ncbi:uncharacterized protein MKK02DRAFT_16352 [Dioszegia hungarica]|uniref:Uncharacterized protein n=1 Tax=Dioszegia hungarica TaxID=4972 RepID=A0AA38H697_9TREE|nr:uncharacterized protein MKK02DRAFT_16352 [Dioszegia hungarica]KAI9634597.1 hypothetical protein MKK02DRAFT_16352 [Dioszegia hungarica]
MSQTEYDAYLARKASDKKKAEDGRQQEKFDKTYASEMKKRYGAKADPGTVAEMVDTNELGEEWFKEGEWKPAWSNVEFDGDACLKNVTKAGKTKDGFYAPAGTIVPLGAAFPHMTVLKYGGYFPAGTSFPGGVMVPMHARMVNVLPQETFVPGAMPEESLCLVQ